MSMEWFDRISGELQDHLASICAEYGEEGIMAIEKGSRHPRIEFYTEVGEEHDTFCVLHFDPLNEEFYIETYDIELGLISRTILEDLEDIIEAVHESFHMYVNGEGDFLGDEFEGVYEEIDIEVDWETPEMTAYIDEEEEVEITYKFGVVSETGDGILQRVNRVVSADNELITDEFNFVFSKEEAGTIISLIASHMDSMKGFEENR
ncbi:hypothetical protein [Bacillus marinisedimentorum]|uniref:hypothetical protein n=1 Tax=Bacillus marinisedimentorum TaxID=1821260 RepID=UPI000871CCA5|nr:hypothetical protein [Bacillus marinisedimentorum]